MKTPRPLHFRSDCWQAAIAPHGGNLFKLCYLPKQFDVVRTPRSYAKFAKATVVYGIPLLFLPNRIEDGWFELEGERYEFPINETSRHNHLHGFIHKQIWQVTSGKNELGAIYTHTPDALWRYPFEVAVNYRFSPKKVDQTVKITNLAKEKMPLLFGQHTVMRLPRKSFIDVTTGRRINLEPQRILPDGTYSKAGTHFTGSEGKLDMHAEIVTKNGFRGAKLTHPEAGLQITYSVDPQYKFWMFWNGSYRNRFFCPEPQTCTVNAVKAAKLLDDSGVRFLAPGESTTLKSSIAVKEL